MIANKFKNPLYDWMKFWGCATFDLDYVAANFFDKFGSTPKAFLARSPFQIVGSIENKKKLVVSQIYGGANAVYVPLLLDKNELTNILSKLGKLNQELYIERRKDEVKTFLLELQEQSRRRTYRRHCNYCGSMYITDALEVVYHCSSSKCRMAHKEFLIEVAERNREAARRERERRGKEIAIDLAEHEAETPIVMPDFTMETQYSRSLQGWVYFVEAANGYVKIGRSDDPSRRFCDFVTMSPIPIWLRHTVFSDNYVMAEANIHNMLNEHRRHGEWFELPAEILEWCLSLDHYDLDDDP